VLCNNIMVVSTQPPDETQCYNRSKRPCTHFAEGNFVIFVIYISFDDFINYAITIDLLSGHNVKFIYGAIYCTNDIFYYYTDQLTM